jgi:hypothetical protein
MVSVKVLVLLLATLCVTLAGAEDPTPSPTPRPQPRDTATPTPEAGAAIVVDVEPTRTPTPPLRSRSLAEIAADVNLRKTAEGRVVISNRDTQSAAQEPLRATPVPATDAPEGADRILDLEFKTDRHLYVILGNELEKNLRGRGRIHIMFAQQIKVPAHEELAFEEVYSGWRTVRSDRFVRFANGEVAFDCGVLVFEEHPDGLPAGILQVSYFPRSGPEHSFAEKHVTFD